MPLPSVRYDLNLGLNNAKAINDLESGQLARAEGIYYRRGSDEVWMKSGRTVFDPVSTGQPGLGLFYAEFSGIGTTSQILARAGQNFMRADVGLTGTFEYLSQSLSPYATGLWGTFANERYYFNDGASDPQVFQYRVSDATYILRQTGLNPPTEQPVVTVNTGGASQVSLTTASCRSTGDKKFSNIGAFADNDAATFATVSMGASGNASRIFAENFTGSGSGSRSDWILSITYDTAITANGRCTTVVSYSTNAGNSYTPYETTTDAQLKHTVTIPLSGTFDSANIGARVVVTKTNENGKVTCNAYEAKLFAAAGTGIADNTVLTGLIYWVTEKIDYAGIESIAGPPSASTGPFTNASTNQVTLPTSQNNPDTTHYNLYRTTDGGAFPSGTLVDTYEVGTQYAYDDGPMNVVASTVVYGSFTVAGIIYHRDVIGPISTVMATYQNAIVVAPVDTPNKIRYSSAGYPESFPLINVINLASDRDDTVMGLAVLSSQLGVFMRGRGVRVDHLPTPSDPTFSIQPEPFSPDNAGLESRNGLCYLTPPGSTNHTHIAYVARDGIRITDLYSSAIVTSNIDWENTVDVTALSTSILRNNPSESRLEFFFTPTASFRTTQGWSADVQASLWFHYQMTDNYEQSKLRPTVQAANVVAAASVPFRGKDYMFLMASGIRVPIGVVYVDEVGSSDAMLTVDSTGIVYRRFETGQMYLDPSSWLTRFKMNRLVINADVHPASVIARVTAGRDDTGQSWSLTQSFTDVLGGAKPLHYNISGQWFQILMTIDGGTTVPTRVRNISFTHEELGELV